MRPEDPTGAPMMFASGTTVSHYRISDKIGAGGMGEVYRAEDTNLSRQVAVKVLPDLFGNDAERLARFEREAKLLAQLNHPNLATVYGLESVQGRRLLVMELVEGETLAERIARGPIPLDETLDICREIAQGMEAAHEKGIIHRDLKPANVKIAPDGKVKVLDFGLAKALHGDVVVSDLSHSPTITENMTRAGVILGTAAYMSPEQAKGRPVGKRADIWAFGCILFECLTGRRAFEGETASETLAAILRGEPEWDRLPAETPAGIRNLLHRCLQKDAAHRLRDIGDAMLDTSDAVAPVETLEKHGRRWRTAVPWAAFALMAVVSGHLWYAGSKRQATDQVPLIASVNPPENSVACFRDGVALSPDGSRLAFVSLSSEGERLLWVRSFDRPDAMLLPGTDGANYPFWSPDSRHLAFYAGGWLKRVPAEGGPVQQLCRSFMYGSWGGSWGSAGSILFCDANTTTSKVAETGGEPVTLPSTSEMGFPCFLPDGRSFLYTRFPAGLDTSTSLWLSSLDDPGFGKEIKGTSAVLRAEWAPLDRLVLFTDAGRSLSTQRVDLAACAVVGPRTPLARPVPSSNGWPCFSVSQTGTLAYVVNPPEASNDVACRLVWVDRKGNALGNLGEVSGYWYIRISPDGRWVICSKEEDVWVIEVGPGLSRRLTNEMASRSYVYNPVWNVQSDRILARSRGIREFPLSGGPPELLVADTLVYATELTDWSRDGKYILLNRFGFSNGLCDVQYFDFGSHAFKPFVATPSYEQAGVFSPDGRWVAYVSDETGSAEVYIRSFPDGRQVTRVSYSGGMHPRWRGDGKELFFLASGWTVMSAVVTWEPDLQVSAPVTLFQMVMADISEGTCPTYDVAPDGQRFLVISPQTKPLPLTLVQNWQGLARQR